MRIRNITLMLFGIVAFALFIVLGRSEQALLSSDDTPDGGGVANATSTSTAQPNPGPTTVATTVGKTDTAAPGDLPQAGGLLTVSKDEPPLPVRGGLSMRPYYNDQGHFLGYQINGRTGDHRYDHGDVITSINGQHVEDSAAGSELLLIALSQRFTELETIARQP